MKNKAFFSLFVAVSLLFLAPSVAKKAEASTIPCTINSFTASPSMLRTGSSASLNWSTSGCTIVHLNGGNFTYNNLLPNSSTTTGLLAGTTSFTLFAEGPSSSARSSVTVVVTSGPYNVLPACSDGVDNDGDGLRDYPADPGCVSPSDNDESGGFNDYSAQTAPLTTVVTIPASNIATSSARFNGIIVTAAPQYTVNFEYGTDVLNLNQATELQINPISPNHTIYEVVKTLAPSTLYYYRIVARSGASVFYGDIHSFTTLTVPTVQSTTPATSTKESSAPLTAADGKPLAVTLTVTNKDDNVNIGETVENTVTYTNNTNKTLKNATLSIVFPQGFTVKQTTEGTMTNQTTVSDTIGTIAPGQTGSIFVEAVPGPNTDTGASLVTNATLNYTANGAEDSAVGYVINHASVQNVFAGFALGSGFFPTTIFGWLITVLIILILILIARRIAKQKHASHGHGDAHGHGGHGAPKH